MAQWIKHLLPKPEDWIWITTALVKSLAGMAVKASVAFSSLDCLGSFLCVAG